MTKPMAAFVTSRCASAVKLVLFLLNIGIGLLVSGQVDGPPCHSTGPTCLKVEDCSKAQNTTFSTHQWCGSCRFALTCQDGYGTLYHLQNQNYPFWDDNTKSAQAHSTTCTECFFPCPPLSEPPPTGPPQGCPSSGPTCVQGPAFCNNVVTPTRFQVCDNCRSYVNCRGIGFISTVDVCPDGTAWDDVAKNCLDRSTTCIECYTYCNETLTTAQPTVTTMVPTTAAEIATSPAPAPTTPGNGNGPPSGGSGGGCRCTCICKGICTCKCSCNAPGN
jgi:hypothetical protein